MNVGSSGGKIIGTSVHVKRAGIASFIFWFLHPGDAKAATVKGDTLELRCRSESKEIPVRNIHEKTGTDHVFFRFSWTEGDGFEIRPLFPNLFLLPGLD